MMGIGYGRDENLTPPLGYTTASVHVIPLGQGLV